MSNDNSEIENNFDSAKILKPEGMYKTFADPSKESHTNSKLTSLFEISGDSSEWWKSTVVYEVYIRSFCDSNGDGIGDLLGIKSKLEYFTNLGVETLWITPFYPSPMKDFGYDISNFMDVDPIFGTLEDFKSLLSDMKNRGLKMVVDIVPNHTSDQHEWFQRSVKREMPFENYYVWKAMKGRDKAGNPNPPNNWVSVFGGPAWTFNTERQEFYLHQFTKEQPDLNFRNPLVIEEMKKILEFWLNLGVDGFRLDAAPHLLEDEDFSDEKPHELLELFADSVTEDEYSYWDHSSTYDLPGVVEILAAFRGVCDNFTAKDGFTRVLMIEAYMDAKSLVKYYGTLEMPVGHFPFNFDLMELEAGFNAADIYLLIENCLQNLPKGCSPNWVIGNHDRPRIATRVGLETANLLTMISLLLPGVALTYYGDELNLKNIDISWENTVDPAGINAGPIKFIKYSRDPCRTPMLWDSTTNAGFTIADQTWLPIHLDYKNLNVEYQNLMDESHLKLFRKLVHIRQEGNVELSCLNENNVFGFTRIDNKSDNALLVVTNFGDSLEHVDVSCFAHIAEILTVEARSLHFQPDRLNINSSVNSHSLELGPKSGIVFSFCPNFNE